MPSTGTSVVLPVFEAFQRARADLAESLADLAVPPAHRPGAEGKLVSAADEAEYRASLQALEAYAGVLARTISPLTHDLVAGVQAAALIALARLARASDRLAAGVAGQSLLPHALQLLGNAAASKEVRRGAAGLLLQMLREPETATQAIEAGVLTLLVENFEDYEPEMKTLALWCFGAVAFPTAAGAAAVADAGGVRMAVAALGESQLVVLRIGASVLADVAKHEAELAAAVVAAGALDALAPLLSSRDPAVRAQATRALAQIGKHGGSSGGARLPAELFPMLISLTADADEQVAQNAATCVREIARCGERDATALVEAGVLPALVDLLVNGRGSPAPAAAALGLLGGLSQPLAEAVVDAGAVAVLAQGLRLSGSAHVRAIVADALRALAARAGSAATACVNVGALAVLQELGGASGDGAADGGACAEAALAALTAVAARLGEDGSYEPLRELVEQSASAPRTLPAALFGLSTLFGSAEDAGRHQAHFVACGLMRALQAQRAGAGVDLARAIDALNGKFPNDVVAQLQPNYEDSLLQKIGE